jgi:hypothetical protein
MTTEQRVYITVNELLEIEFRCKECHVVFSWPITSGGFQIDNCPGCNREWLSRGVDQRRTNLNHLLIALRALSNLSESDFELRFRVAPHADA